MKHSNSKAYKISGGVLRSLVITLALVIVMTVTSFADVTIEKEWDDGLTGAKAGSRSAPTVNLEGTTSYEQLLNLFYPVGCYFETEDNNFNPNTAWGGTWEKIEDGRVLIAANSTYPAGSTGGEAKHTLTVAEMPSHTHGLRCEYGTNANLNSGPPGQYNQITNNTAYGYITSNNPVSGTGGNGAHNNMQPYRAVNMWKRTA